jgi:hypothetical protein
MNIIKSTGKTVAALALAFSITACGNDWLDREPGTGLPEERALTNSESLNNARIGLYNALKGRNNNYVDYYGATFFVYAEMRGEDMQYNSKYGSTRAPFWYRQEGNKPEEFNYGNSVWRSAFIVIARANRIVEAATSGALTDRGTKADSVINLCRDEAKVLRAMAMFDLTRIYGKPYTQDQGASWGAPANTSVLDPNAKVKRNTVAECYTQILKDLDEAIQGNLVMTPNTGYVNLWTAKTLRSRVYLTMGNWAKALADAEDVIQNSPYSLWTPTQYATAWSKNDANHGNEMIFEIAITSSEWTDREGIGYLYTEDTDAKDVPKGYGDMVATKAFVDSLNTDGNDVRRDVWKAATSSKEKKANVFNGARVYLNKLPAINGDTRLSNVPLMRLSELYLNAAEAAFQAGDKAKAAQYLNAIVTNRTTTASRQVTAANVSLARIYMERRKELVGEGHRYFDALRRGETITRYTSEANRGWHEALNKDVQSYNTWTFNKQLPLIPIDEVNGNSEIQQNPLY